VCGNAVAARGDALGFCRGGATAGAPAGPGSDTSGTDSAGGGNQVTIPISIPANVCGNSVGVLGSARSSCQKSSGCQGSSAGHHGTPPPCAKHHHHGMPPPYHKKPRPHHKPGRHHHHGKTPPDGHHHGRQGRHGGIGTTSSSRPVTSTLPTTGANLLGLLSVACAVTAGGAGCLLLVNRRRLARGLLVGSMRAVRSFAAAR
jgi:hypothetical protein